MSRYNLIAGSCVQVLPEIARESAQTSVTSPPYWGLRDYGIEPSEWPEIQFAPMAGQLPVTVPAMACCLGLEADPLAYIAHLVHVFRLLWPVLKADGTLWLNLGDSYAGKRKSTGKTVSSRRDDAEIPRSDRQVIGLKSKDLVGIPWRVAFALQADGWYLRQDLIWHKPNPLPESAKDRCTKAHEYLFLLSKAEKYWFNAASILEPCSSKYEGKDLEYTGQARKDYSAGRAQNPSDTKRRVIASMVARGFKRNRRSVWTVPTRGFRGAHIATFPPALIRPCVLAGSPRDSVVIDPFSGSGTTGKVCLQEGRLYVGIEQSPVSLKESHDRLAVVQGNLFSENEVAA